MDTAIFTNFRNSVISECTKVILGKDEIIEKICICYLCNGHVLLEDVPGTGKTMLLRAFSRVVGGNFKRIQFTPDLLPSDLTGIHYYNQKIKDFEFRPGPLFADIVLADEINRATPRTQSSLLEAMEEHQISIDGETFPLNDSFMVMATQNPLESYGTFPLPEAQIDRFFMRLSLGRMKRDQEITVLQRKNAVDLLDSVERVVFPETISSLREALPIITVSAVCCDYLMDLIEKTRSIDSLNAGVSTRGAIALYRASQVCAAFHGRDYVIPEDIKEMAIPVLAHRLSGQSTSRLDSEAYLQSILNELPVPLEN